MSTEHEGPEPGDYILSPVGRLGSQTSVDVVEGPHIGIFTCDDEASTVAFERMDSVQVWTDVWIMSDHGNLRRMEVEP